MSLRCFNAALYAGARRVRKPGILNVVCATSGQIRWLRALQWQRTGWLTQSHARPLVAKTAGRLHCGNVRPPRPNDLQELR